MGLREIQILEQGLHDLKAGCILQLLVDIKKRKVFHIPSKLSHEEAVELHTGKSFNELNEDLHRYVAVYIEIIKGIINKKIQYGLSSFEMGHHYHHTSTEVAKAQILINSMVKAYQKSHLEPV